MAINKVGSKGIEDGSVATVDLAPGSVTNAKLTNSSFTFDGTSVSLGASENISLSASWQSVITADGSTGTTAVAGNGYFIDTTSATHTLTLPASATIGDFIAIKDYAGTFATNNLTIARNGHNIQGDANDSLISTNRASLVLVYVDSTKGWLYWEEHNVQAFTKFVTATGGTVTESGDYKIHAFTGDGCFVVSCAGNSGGSNSVDILVVAGGGGGGYSGGGGAGGFRLLTCQPVTATTYPLTVGGGGTGAPTPSAAQAPSGSSSSGLSITSAGGGGGGHYDQPTPRDGANGGSGGGGSRCGSGGSGNTPPVSPPQGNNGGNGFPGYEGGGGGASSTGANGIPGTSAGPGGSGSPVTSIFGCAPQPFYLTDSPNAGTVSTGYFAGGGAGGATPSAPTQATGGIGGGGNCISGPSAGAGVTNSGGGGGGNYSGTGGAGGKGIVIIRYKFQ